jgi:hypothetical protein
MATEPTRQSGSTHAMSTLECIERPVGRNDHGDVPERPMISFSELRELFAAIDQKAQQTKPKYQTEDWSFLEFFHKLRRDRKD